VVVNNIAEESIAFIIRVEDDYQQFGGTYHLSFDP
jgi:hypothetical protein